MAEQQFQLRQPGRIHNVPEDSAAQPCVCLRITWGTWDGSGSWAPLSEVPVWEAWGGDRAKFPAGADAASQCLQHSRPCVPRYWGLSQLPSLGSSPEAETLIGESPSTGSKPGKQIVTNRLSSSLTSHKRREKWSFYYKPGVWAG